MDCIDGMKQINSCSINLILTDPPYNIGKEFDNDNLSMGDYLDWCKEWIPELNRVLKWGGAIFITLGWKYVAEVKNIFNNQKELRLKNWIIWYRQDGWKGDKGFAQSYENILYFIKDNVSEERINSFREWLNKHRIKKGYSLSNINNILGWAITGGGCASGYMGDKEDKQIPSPEHYKKLKELLSLDDTYDKLVFEEKYIKFNKVDVCDDLWLTPKSEKKRLGHPTQKPLTLFQRILRTSSEINDLVLDPFMGSGTTAFACKSLKRNFIGFEIDKEYSDIVNNRMKQECII